MAPTAPTCAAWTSWLLKPMEYLGFIINLFKCDLVPARQFDFVDIAFDLDNSTAQHQVLNLLNTLLMFSSSSAPPAVKWQQLLSHITSLEKLITQGCLHMQPIQLPCMTAGTSQHTPSSNWYRFCQSTSVPSVVVTDGQPDPKGPPSPHPSAAALH